MKNIKKWKILKEADVSPSKWFPVFQHTVELPNGTVIDDYFISRMIHAVMVLPITKGNKIVFTKQYKHGLGEITLELPAGFQQEGKTPEESALAELEEEVGIKAEASDLIRIGEVSNVPTKIMHIVHCYLVRNAEFNPKQNLEVTEDIEIVAVSPQETLKMIKEGKIWVADTVACVMKASLLYPEIFAGFDRESKK